MNQPAHATAWKIRTLGLSLNGQFGAFPPTRLKQLADLVSADYPTKPSISIGGAASPIPGMNIFVGPVGALVVGPTGWVQNYIAAKTTLDFADAAALFQRAVEAGLAPDEIAYNVQSA